MKTLRATCSSSSRPAEPVARVVQTKTKQAWFDEQLKLNHDLGATKSIGDFLRQIIEIDSKPVALLAWGLACHALKDRDLWISWSAPQRVERLKLGAQNRRLLILWPKGTFPQPGLSGHGGRLACSARPVVCGLRVPPRCG